MAPLLVVKGWTLLAHPLFIHQIQTLAHEVEDAREKDPARYTRKNATKRLAAIRKLILDIIPADPADPRYRQGSMLGSGHKHWFRAKFFQQYRLFFRYHAAARIIVYAWVNDADTLRAYGSKTDAYRTFTKMLDAGDPPDDWDALLKASAGMDPGFSI